jgi:hypothetical protein
MHELADVGAAATQAFEPGPRDPAQRIVRLSEPRLDVRITPDRA